MGNKIPFMGYSATPKTAQEFRAESIAGSWSYDVEMERMAQLEASRPTDFDKLGPALKMQLGYYLDGKAAAQAAGLNTNGAAA